MVTDTTVELRTCPYCGKDGFKGEQGVRMHIGRCPKFMLPDARIADQTVPETDAEREHVARAAEQQPAAILGTSSWRVESAPPAEMPGSVRDPQSRVFNVTHAWYFAPPTVDVEELMSTTGLPVDVFHSASSWQAHQVQRQREMGHILVTPIERFGMKKRGAPYVHVLPPDPEVWSEIVDLWRPAIEQEALIETERLEQAETDLARATDANERSSARTRIRRFSTRVLQLRSLDPNRALVFFQREHQFSRQGGRTDTQLLDDQIDSRIETRLEGMFDEHVG